MLKYLYILAAVILLSSVPHPALALEIGAKELPTQNATGEESYVLDLRQAKQNAREIFRVATIAKRTIERIKSKGGIVPSDYESFLNSLIETADNFIKNTEEGQAVREMTENIEDGAKQLNTVINPGISVIIEWQSTAKEAEKDLRNLARQLERAKKKAEKREDGSAVIVPLVQSLLNTTNDAFLTAKNMAAEGYAGSALIFYRGTVEKKMETLSDGIRVFENIYNLTLLIKKIDIEIVRIERKIRNLNASSADIKDLNALVAEIREKRASLAGENKKDEEIFTTLVELEKLQRNITEKINSLENRSNDE